MNGVAFGKVGALLGCLLCALGCAPHVGHEAGARRPALSSAPASDDWAGLSWEDRHDQMTFLVLPNMARLFQRYKDKRDPDLTCRSCHGIDAESVQYRMPHGLPPLDPAHMPDQSHGIGQFMAEQVTPQMIEFLGVPPFDAQSGRGFGCFSCHARLGT